MTDARSRLWDRWRNLDHARRFSVAALVSVAACALLFGWLLQGTVQRIVRKNDEAQTAAFVRHVISTEFRDILFQSRQPIEDPQLGRRLLEALALDEVFRIKVYDAEGRIIWSDERELLGIRFPDNEFLNSALRGEVVTVIEAPERSEHVYERGVFDEIMETYVPIHHEGKVVGVVEIYRYPSTLFLETRIGTGLLWLASIGGGALLYLAMVGVVRRINNTQRRLERDLRRSTGELEEEKSKLERIVNAMGAGLVLVGPDSVIQWANERAGSWFGGGATLVGARSLEKFCGDSLRCERCPFDPANPRPCDPVVCEHEVQGDDGRKRVYQLITTPAPSVDDAGRPGNFLQLLLDVTESKAVEAQLRQADRMSLTGQLAAGIAHQINNPAGILLTTITHHLAKSPGTVGEDLRGDLEMMERQCRRIDQSVRSLLSFSRTPKGIREPLELRGILEEAIQLTEPRTRRSSVTVTTSHDDEPYVTMGDPNDVLQVVLNLINNAIDAMANGGDLNLILDRTWVRNDPAVRLTVRDTGEGLPPGDPERVFEPFFTTKQIGRGTGLGLAISRRIVESIGGDIRATSGADGGAVFEVRLPSTRAPREQ